MVFDYMHSELRFFLISDSAGFTKIYCLSWINLLYANLSVILDFANLIALKYCNIFFSTFLVLSFFSFLLIFNVLHTQVLPSAAISYFVYEFMKILLKVEWREKLIREEEFVQRLYNRFRMVGLYQHSICHWCWQRYFFIAKGGKLNPHLHSNILLKS